MSLPKVPLKRCYLKEAISFFANCCQKEQLSIHYLNYVFILQILKGNY